MNEASGGGFPIFEEEEVSDGARALRKVVFQRSDWMGGCFRGGGEQELSRGFGVFVGREH